MFWLVTKKAIKKELKKIKDSFKKRDDDIKELKEEIVSKDMIKLMIENEILKVRAHTPRTPRTPMRKKADKILNKAEIMHEIGSLLQKGLSTEEVHHQIVKVRGLCKKTCFYKYLKLVRKKVREPTIRTPRTNSAN